MSEAGPSRYVTPGGELPLSNLGQLELLRTMMERGLPLRMRARGASMKPMIRDDDIVTITPMGGREPRVGEVLACVRPGAERLVLHRVVAREAGGWLLRGDNCTMADGVVPPQDVLGAVTRVERNGHDIDFGVGRKGVGIARLSRAGILRTLGGPRRIARRGASALLRRSQDLGLYRAVGRRLAPRFDIREATASDLRALRRMWNSGESNPSPSEAGDPSAVNWVAMHNSAIAGFVQLVHDGAPGTAWPGHWLFSLWVRGRYRGLGLGQTLTSRVIERAGTDGAKRLSLLVFEDDHRAIRLYGKLGFIPAVVAELEAALQAERLLNGRGRVVMTRDLEGERV